MTKSGCSASGGQTWTLVILALFLFIRRNQRRPR
jgi:MYXO-CTERM domain-containing protein